MVESKVERQDLPHLVHSLIVSSSDKEGYAVLTISSSRVRYACSRKCATESGLSGASPADVSNKLPTTKDRDMRRAPPQISHMTCTAAVLEASALSAWSAVEPAPNLAACKPAPRSTHPLVLFCFSSP